MEESFLILKRDPEREGEGGSVGGGGGGVGKDDKSLVLSTVVAPDLELSVRARGTFCCNLGERGA
jgi:hypothetical protein